MESKQIKGLNRNTIDKYYTKENVVDLCVNYVKKYIQINPETDFIIEPSAGNGSFITGIKSLSSKCIFYDLEPENEEIIKQDYLLYDYEITRKTYNKIHIIGNPPFGRQSSLAIKLNLLKNPVNSATVYHLYYPKVSKKRVYTLEYLNRHTLCAF